MSGKKLESDFAAFVMEHLEPLTEVLAKTVQRIVNSEFDPCVKSIRFEIFGDGFTEGLPISVYYLDDLRTECAFCPHQPMVEVKEVYPYDNVLFDAYEQDGVDTFKTASRTCIAWFVECWKASGGSNCPVDAEIAIHDSNECVNLMESLD